MQLLIPSIDVDNYAMLDSIKMFDLGWSCKQLYSYEITDLWLITGWTGNFYFQIKKWHSALYKVSNFGLKIAFRLQMQVWISWVNVFARVYNRKN